MYIRFVMQLSTSGKLRVIEPENSWMCYRRRKRRNKDEEENMLEVHNMYENPMYVREKRKQ